jgi:hypothetical protein
MAITRTDPDEDFLQLECERFLSIMSSDNAQDERNALFRSIMLTVRERVEREIRTRSFTNYPVLFQRTPPGPFINEGQLDLAPNIWSYQMTNYVKAVLEVLRKKNNTLGLGDGFR